MFRKCVSWKYKKKKHTNHNVFRSLNKKIEKIRLFETNWRRKKLHTQMEMDYLNVNCRRKNEIKKTSVISFNDICNINRKISYLLLSIVAFYPHFIYCWSNRQTNNNFSFFLSKSSSHCVMAITEITFQTNQFILCNTW